MKKSNPHREKVSGKGIRMIFSTQEENPETVFHVFFLLAWRYARATAYRNPAHAIRVGNQDVDSTDGGAPTATCRGLAA